MAKIATVNNLNTLINYLGTSLDWPVDNDSLDELVFEYEAFELGIHDENTVKIKNIFRFRPFIAGQPWSVFYIEFATGTLPIVVMRRILNNLVIRQRAGTQDMQRWNVNDLLFISNFGSESDRKLSFAHFTQPADGKSMPTLKVLGWDGDDTKLRLDDVERRLTTYLKYPDADIANWPARWQVAFTLRPREVIKTSQELSKQLARLARDIRDRLNTVMQYESDKGQFTLLMKSFQSALIHDLNAGDFADMYAQTIAYGLLSTRIADPSKTSVDDFTLTLQTNPFLRDLLTTFLRMGGRDTGGSGLDFDELGIQEVGELLDQANMSEVLRDFNNRNAAEDPVIHFYELFLKEYDAKKRMQRGVFYTPKPVVGYIVRSVHELLQTEFGLPDGLASTETWADMQQRLPDLKLPPRSVFIDGPSKERIDPTTPFVQILDPATGTGTFLVEVIDVIYRTLMTKWANLSEAQRTQRWNAYVPTHLLPRLYGYELMMAPYTIAHLKIGLKLLETGYTFASEQRANIYLTNALEPAQTQLVLAGITPALAHEAAAVNTVKLNTRYTVVVGNPPYAGHSRNNGLEWIVDQIQDYKKDYPDLSKPGQGKWLQDDYVKFYRLAEDIIEKVDFGIISYITNSSWLENPTFKGMRRNFIEKFDNLFVVDLHGSTVKNESDENVFDIRQGVAICVLLRKKHLQINAMTGNLIVKKADIHGNRTNKYDALMETGLLAINFSNVNVISPFYYFTQLDQLLMSEYNAFPSILSFFNSGDPAPGFVTTHDDFAISFTVNEQSNKVSTLLQTTDELEARSIFKLCSQNQWIYSEAKESLSKMNWTKDLLQISYRPFDERWTVFNRYVAVHRRDRIARHMLECSNKAIILSRQLSASETWSLVFCSNKMIESTYISNRTREINYVFPLKIVENNRVISNIDSALFDGVQQKYHDTDNMPIFTYIYAILFSQNYRLKYTSLLSKDFPRIPLPGGPDVFHALVPLGEQLVALHLMESPLLDTPITHTVGDNWTVGKVGYADGTVWIDGKGTKAAYAAGTTGFVGVPEEVWNFHIGGYQVCEKWLKDRKNRTLSADDIVHYQKIVVALHETIRLMADIDVVIEEHGGWPGAFHVADVSVADEPARPQFGQVPTATSKRKAAEDKDQGSFLDE